MKRAGIATFRLACAFAVAATSVLVAPARAQAGPGENPCQLAINLLCRFVPIAPELDHDVDLTTQLPSPDEGGGGLVPQQPAAAELP